MLAAARNNFGSGLGNRNDPANLASIAVPINYDNDASTMLGNPTVNGQANLGLLWRITA